MTPQILSIRLTAEQTALVAPILAQQRKDQSNAHLSLVSSSYEPDLGQATVKLDVAWMDRKLAHKIVQLIRKTEGGRVE